MRFEKPEKESAESKKIQEAYNKHGGTNAAARKLGISGQLLSRWKRKGKVPLKRVAWMSKELEISPFDLNEIETTLIHEVIKTWL